MVGVDNFLGPEVFTFAFPLGFFAVVVVWLALQRRPNR